jgi:acetylglutamate kinase
LFFLTDVPGVRDRRGETLARLDPAGVRELVASGVAHGGMQAKLESSVQALESGLQEVVVASGQTKDVCRDLLSGQPCGTRISRQKTSGVA